MKVILFFVLLFILPVIAYSQERQYSTTDKDAIKHYALANENLDYHEFDEAIDNLQKSIQDDPKFIEAHYLLADVYTIIRKIKPAIE